MLSETTFTFSVVQIFPFKYLMICMFLTPRQTHGPLQQYLARYQVKGHAAEVIGTQLYIHGGSKFSRWPNAVFYFYNDLYILDTETFVWRKAVTSGDIPSHREGHTCSAWGNKLVLVGGRGRYRNYLADVHILNTDTLVWTKLNTFGQIMPPRAAHTTVSVGKNLFIFGGYFPANSLFDDLHKIDLDTGVWTKFTGIGEGPSPRFTLAGGVLYSRNAAVLVLFGGCDCERKPTEDVYYFHTGLQMEDHGSEAKYHKQGQGSTNLREYLSFPGFRPFQATIKETLPDRYIIETTINGKLRHGFLFRPINGPNPSPVNPCRSKSVIRMRSLSRADDRASKHKSLMKSAL